MLGLHNLKPLVKKRKRVGRGGSRGGTSGRGMKGQKARSGPKIDPGFEGGQMPLYRRLPKRGFNNAPFQQVICTVNIGRLNESFSNGDHVTKEALLERGLIKMRRDAKFILKILGQGALNKKLIVHADRVSAPAQQAITTAGGEVKLIS